MTQRWDGERMAALERYMAGEITSRETARLAGKTVNQVEYAARYYRAAEDRRGRGQAKGRREAVAAAVFAEAVRPS